MDNFLENRNAEEKCTLKSARFDHFQQWRGQGEEKSQDAPETSVMAINPEKLVDVDMPKNLSGGSVHPTVQLLKDDGKITRILITCSCGECVELECNY